MARDARALTPAEQALVDQMAVIGGDTARRQLARFYAAGLLAYHDDPVAAAAVVQAAITKGLTNDQFAAACSGVRLGASVNRPGGKTVADVLVAVNATVVGVGNAVKP